MKLHLGCGKRILKGYLQCDLMDYPHVDIKTDITCLSTFNDNSVDEIYVCHALEHVGREKIFETLKEWFRVLKPDGFLRIAVPDFEVCAKMYMEDKQILGRLMGLLYGGQENNLDFHNLCFDEELLGRLLGEIGFDWVQRYDEEDFLPKDFDDYSKAYLNNELVSLNLLAHKPKQEPKKQNPDEIPELFQIIIGKKLLEKKKKQK